MAKKLKVGVIGTGAIAQSVHLPAWQELQKEGRIELAGACDLVEECARLAVESFGARKAYTDYKTMLSEIDFDIIDVCTQNCGHAPIAIDAMSAGAHVMVEKPIAMNVAEAETMIATAEKHRRKLMVGQNQRFEASHERLKTEIDSGRLGRIYTANARYRRRRGIPGWGKFHIASESRGGPMIDIGVHFIDLCMWLMDFPRPIAVSGKTYRMFGDRPDLCNGSWGFGYPPSEFDVEDYASAFVRLENDITLIVETSWAANLPQDENTIVVLGDKAGVSTNPLGVFGYTTNALTRETFDWLPQQQSHRMEIRHFVDCVLNDRPVRVQPWQSLMVQQIIDAIYESSEKNQEVPIR